MTPLIGRYLLLGYVLFIFGATVGVTKRRPRPGFGSLRPSVWQLRTEKPKPSAAFSMKNVAQGDSKSDVQCTEGSKWRKDCNWCNCTLGVGSCTRKGCLPGAVPSKEPECEGISKWKRREIGNNKCSWCVCENGNGACKPVPCSDPSRGNDATSNQPNISERDRTQPNIGERDRTQPNDFGGPQNPPNDIGGPHNRPHEFGGPQNPPNKFGNPQNRTNDFGDPQNPPNDFGGPQNRPNDFGGSQNRPNDFGGSRTRPNIGGRQDRPNDFGGRQNQTSRPTGSEAENQTNEAAGALNQPNRISGSKVDTNCTPGSRWREGCNWCHCGRDSVEVSCSRVGCSSDITYPGPECEGDSEWKRNDREDCSWCVCEDGEAVCDPDIC